VGTVDRFKMVEKEILKGMVSKRKLTYPQKAIFLDRDGTLNVYKGFINEVDDIELLPGVIDAIKKINKSGYLAVVVSNQPIIARGEASFATVEQMFAKIETLLGKEGAYIDDYYYCPHHPDKGFKGEVKRLKKVCDCRKPNIGLLIKAQNKYAIDLQSSFMVGDSILDYQTAKNASMPCYLVETGAKNASLDFNAKDLNEAVNKILGEE
jgi:D,D-heptose 1,7-bisphosphate phosphatase